jgi:hypothetical protein
VHRLDDHTALGLDKCRIQADASDPGKEAGGSHFKNLLNVLGIRIDADKRSNTLSMSKEPKMQKMASGEIRVCHKFTPAQLAVFSSRSRATNGG